VSWQSSSQVVRQDTCASLDPQHITTITATNSKAHCSHRGIGTQELPGRMLKKVGKSDDHRLHQNEQVEAAVEQ
jgi:hypothetical protein